METNLTPQQERDALVAMMRKPKRALVVDDNEEVLVALGVVFESMGMEVVKDKTPEEGILAFEDGEYSVAVVDLVFPRELSSLDGIDLIKHIRGKHPILPPVILLTGYPHHERIKAIGDIPGPVTVVPKPFKDINIPEFLLRFMGGLHV